MTCIRRPALAILLCTAAATLLATPANSQSPAAAEDAAKDLVNSNTAFACDLYARLAAPKEAAPQDRPNLFFSPFSISTAVAMAYGGARGETETQMAAVMHFDLSQAKLHPAFRQLLTSLRARAEGKKAYDLKIANAVWAQRGYDFKAEFLNRTSLNYSTGLQQVDFEGAADAAGRSINAWAEKETQGKIKGLIGPGGLNSLTRLVLTNAIYFKGKWVHPFEKGRTRDDAPFFPLVRKPPAGAGEAAIPPSSTLPLMARTAPFKYMENDALQALEMPYQGGDLAMFVILPKMPGRPRGDMSPPSYYVEDFATVEKSVTPENIAAWRAAARSLKVEAYLPRFKMLRSLALAATLKTMGMTDAFDGPKADFSGIAGRKPLFISSIVHTALVDVYEEGTEATAATGVTSQYLDVAPAQPVVFRADHPFVFLILDLKSGAILFMGRLIKPGEDTQGTSGF